MYLITVYRVIIVKEKKGGFAAWGSSVFKRRRSAPLSGQRTNRLSQPILCMVGGLDCKFSDMAIELNNM